MSNFTIGHRWEQVHAVHTGDAAFLQYVRVPLARREIAGCLGMGRGSGLRDTRDIEAEPPRSSHAVPVTGRPHGPL